MFKILGALLVIVSGTLIGFHFAAQVANRPKQIRGLILAMQRLETEIMYGFTPLADAMQKIGSQCMEPLKTIFLATSRLLTEQSEFTAQQSWQHSIESHWKWTAMKGNEKTILHQLGYTLGTSDRNDQIKHIRLAVNQLEQEEAIARDEQFRYEKMYKSLGPLAGALIVILIY